MRAAPSSSPTRDIRRSRWRTCPSTTVSSTRPSRTAAARDGPSQADGPGHLEIEAGERGRRRRVRAEPVRHHQPVEAPLAPQDAVDEVGLLAAVGPVDLVVGGHHGPDAGLPYGGFEGDEVDLPKGPLGDLGADGHPLVLLVVAGEVLDAAPDPAPLHPLDVGDGEAGRQQRVLGEGLEGAPGQRRAQGCRPSARAARGRPWTPPRPPARRPGGPPGTGSTSTRSPCRRASDRERRPMRLSPRTPDGPSDTLSAGMPSRSTGGRCHRSAPAVREHFSSRVMAPMSRSTSTTCPRRAAAPCRPPTSAVGAPPTRARARSGPGSRAGSITSSISKCAATFSALPCS